MCSNLVHMIRVVRIIMTNFFMSVVPEPYLFQILLQSSLFDPKKSRYQSYFVINYYSKKSKILPHSSRQDAKFTKVKVYYQQWMLNLSQIPHERLSFWPSGRLTKSIFCSKITILCLLLITESTFSCFKIKNMQQPYHFYNRFIFI